MMAFVVIIFNSYLYRLSYLFNCVEILCPLRYTSAVFATKSRKYVKYSLLHMTYKTVGADIGIFQPTFFEREERTLKVDHGIFCWYCYFNNFTFNNFIFNVTEQEGSRPFPCL